MLSATRDPIDRALVPRSGFMVARRSPTLAKRSVAALAPKKTPEASPQENTPVAETAPSDPAYNADEEPPVDCPRCGKPLIVIEREGIELDGCPGCRGLWFDAGELELLAEKSGLDVSELDVSGLPGAQGAEKGMACPRCDRTLDKAWFDPKRTILVDRCAHGLWFDRGEVGRALDSLQPDAAGVSGTIVSFLGESSRR